jgi:hypothetical protein
VPRRCALPFPSFARVPSCRRCTIQFLSPRVPSRFLTRLSPFNLLSYIICPHSPLGRIHQNSHLYQRGADHQHALKHVVFLACPVTLVSFLGHQLVGAETGKPGKRYLQHGVGGTVPTVGRIKIARKAGNFAAPANVDGYRPTIDTAETSASNVLLTTTPPVRGRQSKHVG